MPIAAWLMSISGPLVMRVLAQLGIGIVTFLGVEAGVTAALSHAQSVYLGAPSVVERVDGGHGSDDGVDDAFFARTLCLTTSRCFGLPRTILQRPGCWWHGVGGR